MILIILSIAEPYAGTALKIPDYEVIWFAEVYVGAVLTLTPLTAAILKRFGVVAVLRACVAGIVLSTTLVFVVDVLQIQPPQWPLLALFALLGVCSAPLAPAAQALAAEIYPEESRGKGMAVWGVGRYGGFLLGAMIAGPIIDATSWSVPLVACLVAAVVSWPLISEPKNFPRDLRHMIDWKGAGLLGLGLIAATFAMSTGTEIGWFDSPFFPIGIIVAVVALTAYILHSRRVGNPVLPLVPLRERTFSVAFVVILISFVMTTGQFSILMLGERIGFSAEVMSLRTTAGGIAQIAGVFLGGLLCRPGLFRPATAAALAISAAGMFSFTLYDSTVSVETIVVTRAIMGFGVGMAVPLLTALAYRHQPDGATADVGTLVVFAMMFGTELGLAILGTVLDEVIRTDVGYPHAYHVVFMIEAIGLLICIPMLLFLRPRRP